MLAYILKAGQCFKENNVSKKSREKCLYICSAASPLVCLEFFTGSQMTRKKAVQWHKRGSEASMRAFLLILMLLTTLPDPIELHLIRLTRMTKDISFTDERIWKTSSFESLRHYPHKTRDIRKTKLKRVLQLACLNRTPCRLKLTLLI